MRSTTLLQTREEESYNMPRRYKSRWKLYARVLLAVAVLLSTFLFVFFTFLYESSTDESARLQKSVLENLDRNFPVGKNSLCPDENILKGPTVNKLGSYPQEKRRVTIGIATVTRPEGRSYLQGTIKNLIDNMNEEEENQVLIVVFVADLNETLKANTRMELSRKFDKYIDQGLLHIIEVTPELYYLPLMNLKKKYGDSDERIKWRSKQNLDYAFLMCYSKELSQYYLHLEDDVIASPSFKSKLQDFISDQEKESKDWPSLDAAFMGHIGKVYHSEDLANLASFFILMYNEMPVDWLIMFWRAMKLELTDNVIDLQKYILPPASLFEHVGDQSSLKEKGEYNKHKEPFFDPYDHKYRGLNPPATVTTSLSTYKGSPQDAYDKGSGYFWVKLPMKEDFVLVTFATALSIREVFVDTGSHQAPNDWLKSGVLQASFVHDPAAPHLQSSHSCGDFKTIGDFEQGKVKVVLDEPKDVKCLRIFIMKNQEEWLFLREIDVWQKSATAS